MGSVREMQKFAERDQNIKHGDGSLQLQMQQQMRLFRAQRNFYIVGFTLFLCLVIKRLLELIIANDNIETETDEAAGGKNENRDINKDLGDGDVCNELRGKIQALKSETKLVKLDTNTIQNKCHYLRKEIK